MEDKTKKIAVIALIFGLMALSQAGALTSSEIISIINDAGFVTSNQTINNITCNNCNISHTQKTVSSDYNITTTDETIFINILNNTVNLTLPTAIKNTNIYNIRAVRYGILYNYPIGAAYSFENNTTDISGNGLNGVNHGITYVLNSSGYAANFSSGAAYDDLGTSFYAENIFSLSMQIINTGTGSGTQYIWARAPNLDVYAPVGILIQSGNLIVCTNSNAAGAYELKTLIPYNQLKHKDTLGFVFNSPKVYFYVNGVLNNTVTFTTYPLFTYYPVENTVIGRAGAYNNYYFNGILDNIVYFKNQALSSSSLPYNNGIFDITPLFYYGKIIPNFNQTLDNQLGTQILYSGQHISIQSDNTNWWTI